MQKKNSIYANSISNIDFSLASGYFKVKQFIKIFFKDFPFIFQWVNTKCMFFLNFKYAYAYKSLFDWNRLRKKKVFIQLLGQIFRNQFNYCKNRILLYLNKSS